MGTQIINHQSVANLIADMAVGVETARLMVLKSAYDVDMGRRNTYFASIAKVQKMALTCSYFTLQGQTVLWIGA